MVCFPIQRHFLEIGPGDPSSRDEHLRPGACDRFFAGRMPAAETAPREELLRCRLRSTKPTDLLVITGVGIVIAAASAAVLLADLRHAVQVERLQWGLFVVLGAGIATIGTYGARLKQEKSRPTTTPIGSGSEQGLYRSS